MKNKYPISHRNEKQLRAAANKYGASESELACIDRLALRKATDSDLYCLRGLAALAYVTKRERQIRQKIRKIRVGLEALEHELDDERVIPECKPRPEDIIKARRALRRQGVDV